MDRRFPLDSEPGEPGADEAAALRELLVSAVPEPPPVPDRLARIEFLVRRRRRRRLAGAALTTAAAAVIGFGALDLDGGMIRTFPEPAGTVTTDPDGARGTHRVCRFGNRHPGDRCLVDCLGGFRPGDPRRLDGRGRSAGQRRS